MPRDSVERIIQEFEAQRQELQERLRLLDNAEEAVIAALSGSVIKGPATRKRKEPSVSDALYEQVLRYLNDNPDSRQADIAEALQLNSGLVSSAVKVAIQRGHAEADRDGRGAQYRTVGYGEGSQQIESGKDAGGSTKGSTGSRKRREPTASN